MNHHHSVIGALVLGVLLAVLIARDVRAADETAMVVIEPARLAPSVVRTTTEERVIFVNRTGRPVHVEFSAMTPGHQVFQVPGKMWALFHVPGRHDYVVHVDEGGRPATLSGAVEVIQATGDRVPTPICDGRAAPSATTEVCIER